MQSEAKENPLIVFGDKDNIKVKVGNVFAIRFQSQPGAGYLWMNGDNLPEITMLGHTYEAIGEPGQIGGPCWQLEKFCASKRGQFNLQMFYGRPWDRKTWVEHHFSIEVN